MVGNLLFEDLPEVEAVVKAAGKPRLREPVRDQIELRAVDLAALIGADHRVRTIWAYVESLDLGAVEQTVRARTHTPGQAPVSPRLLLALWLYATSEGVGSARALAKLCTSHDAYRWLCGGVSVNHKTLADFRVAHAALLDRLLTDSFAAMLAAGMASLERVAQDGVRVRAAAGAASFRRRPRLLELRRQAGARVAALRAELESDPAALSRRQAAARERAARERLERIEAALAAVERLNAKAAPRASSAAEPEAKARTEPKAEPRVSTTDAEARVMKMADGGFRPAYNLQFASDTESGMIAGLSLDACGSDMGKLAPMVGKLAAAYGSPPGQHLADGGYASLADVQALEALGTTAYVPVPKPKDVGRDRHRPRADDSPAIAAWRQRMGSSDARAIYKERAATAECANAQARNRGLRQFPVRGLAKVTAIALWFALAHNMMRILALTGAADSVL